MNAEPRTVDRRLSGRDHHLTRTARRRHVKDPRRSGLLTAWSVFALALAMTCTALVVNHVWISGIRQDALRCAEAASLAAAHSLLSDDLLRSRQQAFEQEWRNQRGREAAVQISQLFRQVTRVPLLNVDDVHLTSGNSAVGVSLDDPAQPLPQPDRVEVRWKTAGNAQQRIPLFLPGLTGISEASLGVAAAAGLQHTPSAFRASTMLSVPVMPCAVPDDGGRTDAPSWTRLIEREQGSDLYTWNDHRKQIESGADGLPELTLTLRVGTPDSQPGTLTPLLFSGNHFETVAFRRWMTDGLELPDRTVGGLTELQFPQQLPTAELTADDLPEILETLRQLQGRARIYCLTEAALSGDRQSGQDAAAVVDAEGSGENERDAAIRVTAGVVKSIRPVAARIMQVRQVSDGEVRVTLQPCLIVTSTAVMDRAGTRANPYIYSIRLLP